MSIYKSCPDAKARRSDYPIESQHTTIVRFSLSLVKNYEIYKIVNFNYYKSMLIEEDDRFVQKETFEDKPVEKPNFKLYVILILAWVLWTSLFLIIFTPKIKSAVQESGVLTLLDTEVKTKEKVKQREVKLAFVTQDGIKLYPLEVSIGRASKYHDAVEGLLLGPSEAILKDKAITYINKNTSLIGLTYSRGICYVELSKEFNDQDQKAVEQIELTLKAFSEIEKVVILKDGVSITQRTV